MSLNPFKEKINEGGVSMTIKRKQAAVIFSVFGILLIMVSAESIQAQMDDSGIGQAFKWRSIGPANMSGRIADIEALDDDFATALIGSASGGVWKSINAGVTWDPIFDTYGAASIGDVAFFQKNPEIIWVGTGEKNTRNSIAWGDGIYKSIDGGKTFTHMGLRDTHSISMIITHSSDPEVVYAAAGGHLWGFTGDRGLFKTTDGGKTWGKLTGGLPDDGKTGAIDLVMDPTDENVLYVGFWQRIRRPYRFDSGGPNGGIFKTTDAGKSWKKLANGLPEGDTGKIGLAICRSKPNVLMAFVEHGFQPKEFFNDGTENADYKDMSKLGTGIYRTEDGGETWQYMNRYNNRPFYYSHIYINPVDDKIVYVVAGSYHISMDGGKTLERQNTGIHGDYHALWSDPNDKDRYYIGNDGGAALTHDHGKNYIFFDNLPLSQFYAVGADMRDPYYVYGGLQDNGSWGGPSLSRDSMGIMTDHWFKIGGGDGFYTPVDPTDWRTVYVESQQGNISRVNVETRETKDIKPSKKNVINYDAYVTKKILKIQEEAGWGKDSPFRFNWNCPIVISHYNPSTVYFGGNFLFKTMDRGESWEIISPDLSTQDPVKIDRKTGGLTADVTGAENHCSIITISESSLKPGIIWVGTDDGNVQLTRDGGKNWTNVQQNFKGVPGGIWVSRVETSHYEEGTCYVTFDGHRSDNFMSWVYKTADFGQTWTSISGNLPEGQVAYVIREDHKNKKLLFLGTEFGLFISTNGGKRWDRFMNNLPTVAVHDLMIHPLYNDVIIGTHGRGIWICDDITPLQQMTKEIDTSSAYLFDQPVVTQWTDVSRGGNRGQFLFKGDNPPRGAMISYYLGVDAKDAKLSISDWAGEQKMTAELKAQSGINKHLWNFEFPPPKLDKEEKKLYDLYLKVTERDVRREINRKLRESLEKRGEKYEGIDRRTQKLEGIPAKPGVYKITLTVNGASMTKPLTVRKDPLLD